MNNRKYYIISIIIKLQIELEIAINKNTQICLNRLNVHILFYK